MAIIKRVGKYQVKLRGSDGRWISQTFGTKKEAEAFELNLRQQKQVGGFVANRANQMTVKEYFTQWFESVKHQASPGWRAEQEGFFETYIEPVLGDRRLKTITPDLVAGVFRKMVEQGRSEQTQLHIYNLMRKMFRDAIELFQLLTFNPVLRGFRPRVPVKETKHLNLDQIRKLLDHVVEKEYGLAIWVQLFMGLRVCELMALKWSDMDLDTGILTVSRSFSRKNSWVAGEKVFNDHPKGRRQHSHRIPRELLDRLQKARGNAISEFVVATSWKAEMLSYEHFLKTLKAYCRELKIPEVGTHGLRHSTSELYMHHGATRDDLRQLFAHSSLDITDRYVHAKGTNLERVANVIQMFPKCSQVAE